MVFSDKAYDIITIIQRWLVALGTAYIGLAAIWGFPFPDEINKTIVVISTFLAAIIEISKSKWNKDHSISITDFTNDTTGDEE
jgi:hypothetical protein